MSHHIITSILDDIIIQIENDQRLIHHIKCLPPDIKQYIYEDFVDPLLMYEKFVRALNDPISQQLDQELIRPMIPAILAKPQYTTACRRIREFNIVYEEHKIKNKKSFRLMNKGDSFATAILFYMYH
jgi:hypothetical protein